MCAGVHLSLWWVVSLPPWRCVRAICLPLFESQVRPATAHPSPALANHAPYSPQGRGQAPTSYASLGMPAGLSIDTTTGVVSGTMTAYTYQAPMLVQATDVDGNTGPVYSAVRLVHQPPASGDGGSGGRR